jgi:glutaredoxin
MAAARLFSAPFRWLLGRFRPCDRAAAAKPAAELSAVLYTRHGCHLCEDAKALLQSHGFQVQEVDIDGDPALFERYDATVPVVVIDGKERFRGRVDELLLRRLVADPRE